MPGAHNNSILLILYLPVLIFITILIVFLLARILFIVVRVDGISMSPTLMHQESVLILRFYPTHWLKKGQIVLIIPPSKIDKKNASLLKRYIDRNQSSPLYIKRIIGLPYETITTHLNQLDEHHREQLLPAYDMNGKREWLIPNFHYFVKGDYPYSSYDSLIWGPVPVECIKGVLFMRLS